jgi:hypothetical protein
MAMKKDKATLETGHAAELERLQRTCYGCGALTRERSESFRALCDSCRAAPVHYEDFGDECEGPAGNLTGHPDFVTCPACWARLEQKDSAP